MHIQYYTFLFQLFISTTDCECVQLSNAGDLVGTHQDTQVTGPQVPWDTLIGQLWKVGFKTY